MSLDWKRQPRGWPYKGDIHDPEYLKERSELFKEHGNGWWRSRPNKINKIAVRKRKKKCQQMTRY